MRVYVYALLLLLLLLFLRSFPPSTIFTFYYIRLHRIGVLARLRDG